MSLKAHEFHINQIRVGKPRELDISADKDLWPKELLDELQEDVPSSELPLNWEEQVQLGFKGTLERFNEGQFKDHMQLKGEVDAAFFTLDIHSGDVIIDKMNFSLNCLLLEKEMVDQLGLDEGGELELNGIVWEVFPFENQIFDMKELLHELLFLNRNPYPELSES